LERVLRSCGLSPDIAFFDLTENQMAAQLKKTIRVNATRVKEAEPEEVAEPIAEEPTLAEVADELAEIKALVSRLAPLAEKGETPDPLVALESEQVALTAKIAGLKAARGQVVAQPATPSPATPKPFNETVADAFRAALNEQTGLTGKVF
jgi:hypothetical protein